MSVESTGELQRELLEAVSRSFYLSIRFLPKKMRRAVVVGYLLARASDTVADSSSENPADRLAALGGMKLAMDEEPPEELSESLLGFVDGVDHAGEKGLLHRCGEVIAAYYQLPLEERVPVQKVIHTIIDGQFGDIQTFEIDPVGGIRSLGNSDALRPYTYAVAGCVGRFWTEIAAVTLGPLVVSGSIDEQLAVGERFGRGLQMINIGREVAKDRANGRCYLPKDWQGEREVSIEDDPAAVWKAAGDWREECSSLIAEGKIYASAMRGVRLRFTAMLPALIAEETLALLNEATWDDVESGVKVTRATVKRLARRALWFAIFGARR